MFLPQRPASSVHQQREPKHHTATPHRRHISCFVRAPECCNVSLLWVQSFKFSNFESRYSHPTLFYCCSACRRTAYAKIQVRLQFPDDYPLTSPSPIVELKSDSLPQPFLRKLTKAAEEAARACPVPTEEAAHVATGGTRSSVGGKNEGKGKAVAALGVVMDAVNKNKFLPCWKELRQAAALVTSR